MEEVEKILCFPVIKNGNSQELSRTSMLIYRFDREYFENTCNRLRSDPSLINKLNKDSSLYRFMNFIYQVILNGIRKITTTSYEEYDTNIYPIDSNLFDEYKMSDVLEKALESILTESEIIKFIQYIPFFTNMIIRIATKTKKFSKTFIEEVKEINKRNILHTISVLTPPQISDKNFFRRILDTESKSILLAALTPILRKSIDSYYSIDFNVYKPGNFTLEKIFRNNDHHFYKEVVAITLDFFNKEFIRLKESFLECASKEVKWTKNLESIIYNMNNIRFYAMQILKSSFFWSYFFQEKIDFLVKISNYEIFKNVYIPNVVKIFSEDENEEDKILFDICKNIFKWYPNENYDDLGCMPFNFEKYSEQFYFSLFIDLKTFDITDERIIGMKNEFQALCKKAIDDTEKDFNEKIKKLEINKFNKFRKLINF